MFWSPSPGVPREATLPEHDHGHDLAGITKWICCWYHTWYNYNVDVDGEDNVDDNVDNVEAHIT